VPVLERKSFAEPGELEQIADLLQSRPADDLAAGIAHDIRDFLGLMLSRHC
jgi:hypothetical protein